MSPLAQHQFSHMANPKVAAWVYGEGLEMWHGGQIWNNVNMFVFSFCLSEPMAIFWEGLFGKRIRPWLPSEWVKYSGPKLVVPLQSLQLLAALVYQSFIHIVTHSAHIALTPGPLLEASPKERQDYPNFSELIGESKDISR